MPLNEAEVSKVLSIDINRYKNVNNIWKWFWKGYFVFVIFTALIGTFSADNISSIGSFIASFTFLFLFIGVPFGIIAVLVYTQLNNKMDTRKLCWNILIVVQESLKQGSYNSVVKFRDEYLSGPDDAALYSKGTEAEMVPFYFKSLFEFGVIDYNDSFWEDKERQNEYSPFVSSGELNCFSVLWPLADEDINRILSSRPDVDDKLIKEWKGKADDYFINERKKEEEFHKRIEKRVARTGEDYGKILKEKSEAFYRAEDQFRKKREEEKNANKQAKANGLYLALTGRCPYCQKNIPKLALICPYCRSKIL